MSISLLINHNNYVQSLYLLISGFKGMSPWVLLMFAVCRNRDSKNLWTFP